MDAPSKRPDWQLLCGAFGSGSGAFILSLLQVRYPTLTADPIIFVVPAGFGLLMGLLIGWWSVPGVTLGTALAAVLSGFGPVDVGLAACTIAVQAGAATLCRGFVLAKCGQTTLFLRLMMVAFLFAVVRGLFVTVGRSALDRPDVFFVVLSAIALEWTAAMVFLPVVMIRQRPIGSWPLRRRIEFAAALLATAVTAQIAYSNTKPLWLDVPFPFGAVFLGLYIWACSRFSVTGSAATTGVLFILLVVNSIARGTFAPDMPLDQSLRVQLELLSGIGILVTIFHLFAAVAGDRHATSEEVNRLHAELTHQNAALQMRVNEAAEKNAFLEAVLAQLPAGVIIVGPTGEILQRNERHRRMFETAIATRLNHLPQGRMSGTGRVRLPYDQWPIVRALTQGETTDGMSVRFELTDGSTGDFHLCATPVRNPAGGILGAVSVLTDVTERNKALRQLRESELKLRMALQSAHMTVVEWDRTDGRFVGADALAEWFHLPAGSCIRQIGDLLAHVHPDDADALKEKVQALMTVKPQCETVFRVRGTDEQVQWVLSRSLVQTDETGQPSGLVTSVLVNVTERYRQLDQLRLLESAVVHARDAVIILEDKPRSGGGRSVLYVNKAFTALSGYESNEVVGRSLHLLRGPKSDPATLDHLRDALDDRRPFQCELLNYRKDRSEFWVELSVVPVPDPSGNYSHWVMIQRDVSDRKRADAELRASREGLAEAQRIAHLGSWEFFVATGEVRWSDEKYRIFGYEPGEITATLPLYMSAVHPDDVQRVTNRYAVELANPPQGSQQQEFRIVRPSGEVRHITEQYYVACDDTGRVTRYHGVTQDVTERRHAQEQLIQAQKMELIGQMAGGIAHDFNNVLTGLIGNLDLVTLPPDDPNRRLIDTATKAAFRATDMTRKLLGFARKSQIRTSPVPLGPIVSEVIDLVGRTTDPRIQLRPAVLTTAKVDGDITLLSQVLLNLCLNARDAMPHGGWIEIRVDVEVFAASAQRPAGRTGRFVRLSVEDNGVGIPDEVKDRMFEPFFTTKPIGQGTGLGLPMVHGIIEQHRGWVECHSEVGRGTRFDLYLPQCGEVVDPMTITPTAALTPRPVFAPAAADERPKTILLVDDEDMIRDLARVVLEANGYRVLEACDGEQAIELYRDRGAEIDLTVLDLTMPRLSGQDTFRALIDLDPDVRVLFSSGYSADTLADTEGAIGLLPKPYRPADLLEVVGAAVAPTAESRLVSAL